MPSQVLQDSFYSKALQAQKKYLIYLPPSFFHHEQAYPVLYLLSGLMDYERTWEDKGHLSHVADQLIAQKKIKEMIIVMPDKDNAATNPDQEFNYGYYLSCELVDHIERHYPILGNAFSRGIEGLSLGAFWTLNLALNAPGKYTSVSSLSTFIVPEFYETAERNASALKQTQTRFRLMCGTQETELIENNAHFHQFLQSLGLSSEFYLEEGPHDWPLWQKDIYGSLQFHSYSFFNR